MAKKRIKFSIQKLHGNALVVLRISCVTSILVILATLISFFYFANVTNTKQDIELFLVLIGLMALLLTPFTRLFVLEKKEIKEHLKLSFMAISVVLLCGIVIFFTISILVQLWRFYLITVFIP